MNRMSFSSDYNARKQKLELAAQRQVFERSQLIRDIGRKAKTDLDAKVAAAAEAKALRIAAIAAGLREVKARKAEIAELVRTTFWSVKVGLRRSRIVMVKAHSTAEALAVDGGEEYELACQNLRQGLTSPEAYAEACATVLVPVND